MTKILVQKLTVQRAHIESGSVKGRILRNGRLKKYDFSWGSHEAYWGKDYLPGDYDGWITELAEEVFDVVNARLVEAGYTDETAVRASLINDGSGWKLDHIELFLEFRTLDMSNRDIEEKFSLPVFALGEGEWRLPACLAEAVVKHDLPIRLVIAS